MILDANGYPKTGSTVSRSRDSFRHTGGSGSEIWYVANQGSALALTTGAPSANFLRAFPFIAPARGGRLDRIACNVTTLLAGNLRIGVYKAVSDANIYPSDLLADSGDISSGSATVKTYTVSLDLEPGALYWLAHVGSVAATLRCMAVGGVSSLLGMTSALSTAPNVGYSVAHAYAALPDPFTAGGVVITAVPIPALAYRFSA